MHMAAAVCVCVYRKYEDSGSSFLSTTPTKNTSEDPILQCLYTVTFFSKYAEVLTFQKL